MNIFSSRLFRTAQAILVLVLATALLYFSSTQQAPRLAVAGILLVVYGFTILWFVIRSR